MENFKSKLEITENEFKKSNEQFSDELKQKEKQLSESISELSRTTNELKFENIGNEGFKFQSKKFTTKS